MSNSVIVFSHPIPDFQFIFLILCTLASNNCGVSYKHFKVCPMCYDLTHCRQTGLPSTDLAAFTMASLIPSGVPSSSLHVHTELRVRAQEATLDLNLLKQALWIYCFPEEVLTLSRGHKSQKTYFS